MDDRVLRLRQVAGQRGVLDVAQGGEVRRVVDERGAAVVECGESTDSAPSLDSR